MIAEILRVILLMVVGLSISAGIFMLLREPSCYEVSKRLDETHTINYDDLDRCWPIDAD